MPTNTYTPLATLTLTSTDSEIIFASIPNGYRDLIVVVNGFTSSNFQFQARFNSDGGSNYPYVQMYAAPTQGSDSGTLTHVRAVFGGSGYPEVAILQIMDYSATDKHKTVLARENAIANSWVGARASRWANNNAINTISLTPVAGTFSIGSTFSLYGVIA
jgi:hypothetical protein